MTSLATVLPALAAPLRNPRILALGPYSTLLRLLLAGVVVLCLSRLGLIIWQWPRVVASDAGARILLQGVRNDLITLGLLAAPAIMVLPLFAIGRRVMLWTRLAGWWFASALVLIVLLELATPQFLMEYDARPNRLFVEYLVHPREVFGMLWEGYRTIICATALAVGVSGWCIVQRFRAWSLACEPWPLSRTLLVWPLVVVVLFLMIRSSAQHRPANLSTFAFCDDPMINSLVVNSTYSVLTALYGMRNEDRSSEIYGDMPFAELVQRTRALIGAPAADYVSDDFPTVHRQIASVRRERPLNLVIVLEESLGAGFVEALGGRPIARNFSGLADDGVWFRRLYATGTRSVRGIEAVVAGFPPTPARSVVKLSKSQQGFFTLAALLRNQGYRTEFIYGGESHFDNMRGFFLGNGFHRVVDQKDFAAPRFTGSWGVSDGDLFAKTHERLQALHGAREPFFVLAFSSSNHSPFAFPEGEVDLVDAEVRTVNNAVRYADHALGEFIERARKSDYWQDAVFLVVADHDTRVYGDALVPIDKFHIPGVILGADIAPRTIDSLASQIDLAPTLLSLMGVDATHPFTGRDLTRTLPEFGASPGGVAPRALMQFDQNFAWLESGIATVLTAGRTPRQFSYDERTHELTPSPRSDPEASRNALAASLLPAWLYRERRYRLPD